jgi:hypothetical protein
LLGFNLFPNLVYSSLMFASLTPVSFLFILFPPAFFYIFRYSFNEEVLLLLASTLFFGFFWYKARTAASEFFGSRVEELYAGFSDLLILKLNRALLLLRLLQKSIQFATKLITRLLPALFLLLEQTVPVELELGEVQLRLFIKKWMVNSLLFEERLDSSAFSYMVGTLSNRFRVSASTEFRSESVNN